MSKEQKQIYLLAGLGVAILGVLAYFNWRLFVPRPSAPIALPPSLPQLVFDAGQRDNLFGRKDFGMLRDYVTPVNWLNYGELGNKEPFRPLTTVGGE